MRLAMIALLLPFVAGHAFAQTPAEAKPGQPAAKDAAQSHPRMTLEQHFAQANTTHDGRLTLEQAKGGFSSIARHFNEIDTGGKGYVTADDIRAWRKSQRSAHHKAAPAADPSPQLHPAYMRGSPPQDGVISTAAHRSAPIPAVPAGSPPPPPKGVDDVAPSAPPARN